MPGLAARKSMSPSPSISAGNTSITSVALEVTIFSGPKSAETFVKVKPINVSPKERLFKYKRVDNNLREAGIFFIEVEIIK